MSLENQPRVDPVLYASTPWGMTIVEAGIEAVRAHFGEPRRASSYWTDVHRAGFDPAGWGIADLSRFVQAAGSGWTVCHLVIRGGDSRAASSPPGAGGPLADIRLRAAPRRKQEVRRLELLSRAFAARAVRFEYEDTGDTLSYELYDNGFWRESFADCQQEERVELRSELGRRQPVAPGCGRSFVEEVFRELRVRVPFVRLVRNPGPAGLVRASIPGETGSIVEIRALDCAVVHRL